MNRPAPPVQDAQRTRQDVNCKPRDADCRLHRRQLRVGARSPRQQRPATSSPSRPSFSSILHFSICTLHFEMKPSPRLPSHFPASPSSSLPVLAPCLRRRGRDEEERYGRDAVSAGWHGAIPVTFRPSGRWTARPDAATTPSGVCLRASLGIARPATCHSP